MCVCGGGGGASLGLNLASFRKKNKMATAGISLKIIHIFLLAVSHR